MKKLLYMLFLIPFIGMVSCGNGGSKLPEGYKEGDANFSVSQFFDDHWSLIEGQPYLLKKSVEINGEIDTGYQQLDSTFFYHIKGLFDKTDISEPKYLVEYDYLYAEEDYYHSLIYTAKDEDLFTQLLVVNLSLTSNRIIHIYVETKKDNLFHTKTQKMTYAPFKYIQIIEYEKSFLSSPKNIKLDYAF